MQNTEDKQISKMGKTKEITVNKKWEVLRSRLSHSSTAYSHAAALLNLALKHGPLILFTFQLQTVKSFLENNI